jgi:hypothetical protein
MLPGMRVLLGATLALVLVPAALATSQPRVRLADRTPATVAGTGFHARERVVVTVYARPAHLSKTVVTTARGTFLARFAQNLVVAQCGQVAVSAVGVRGDRAAWKTPPEVCGAPPQPIGQ